MKASRTLRLWALVALVLAASLNLGCSTFRGSIKMDMTPFAENTSMMFAEAAKVSRPFRAVHLRPYVNVPELEVVRLQAAPIITGLHALVLYSNQVVALNMASKSDRDKNDLLARYLENATRDVASRDKLENLGISGTMLDSTFVAIRSASTFLEGVEAASTLVNGVVLALLDGLDGLNETLPKLIVAIDAQIEHNFSEKRTAFEGLTKLQARYLNAAKWLYEGKSGDPTAVDSLLRIDPSMSTFIPSAGEVTSAQLDAAEQELVQRLDRLSEMVEHLALARAAYNAAQQELADLRINLDQRVKVARDAVVVWGQSHRNLGAGVPVPPLINLSAIASNVTEKVPLP